jgi:hypothetical protein
MKKRVHGIIMTARPSRFIIGRLSVNLSVDEDIFFHKKK